MLRNLKHLQTDYLNKNLILLVGDFQTKIWKFHLKYEWKYDCINF